jgi:CO/xanthine dehydrogenase FAD-binding subunit
MKPAPFRYVAAKSLEHALAVKAEHGEDASFLAGGQSLIPAMNFRLAQPAVLVDINPLGALDYICRSDNRAIRIGALVRHRTIERDALVTQHQPLIREALPHVAHPQIRNRGTLGGNLAHADPASELPAILLAMEGRVQARSVGGERWIAAREFFLGALTTALRADEMLTAIELPDLPPRSGTCFMEVARRRGDFAMLGVAAIVTLAEDHTCLQARLAFCNAGATPMAARKAAQALVGHRIADAQIRIAAGLAQREIDPSGNVHASEAYQRHLAGVLTGRALRVALERVPS